MKILIAIENKKINNIFNNINNNNLIIQKVLYREAILEILKKEENIDFILLYEKLPGKISIEDLINKIKKINKKINIIFFLEKENINKKNTLNNLLIKNIFIIKKLNKKNLLNMIFLKEKNFNKKFKNIEKTKNNIINNITDKEDQKIFNNMIKRVFNKIISKIKKYKNNNYIKNNYKKINNIISVYGEPRSGKTTIIFLLINNLLEKNKKILIINFNKKENKFIKTNNKFNIKKNKIINVKNNLSVINYLKYSLKETKENKIKNFEILESLIKKNKEIFDYIILDIGYIQDKKSREKIISLGDKKIFVFTKEILGIKELIKKYKTKEKGRRKATTSLHIIQNKYNFNSISSLIIHNILDKVCFVYRISYNKNLKDFKNNFLNNKKIKIKYQIKKEIKKIINNIK